MFDLVFDTIYFASFSNFYGLSNISLSSFDILLAYIVAIVCSIIVALVLRLPLLPSKPYRYSFDVSALYPTPIIAIGILSIFLVLNYTFMYNGLVLAVVIGVLSALFVKYLFDFVFPKPLDNNAGEDINE
ncbi:MAG: energy-converting hydrogenase A subunit A EhaA [Methanobrevibacter thaueri]|jgi:energy-converting hydrogenase A subunit A|uniref:Probable [NiFe]-hydrogenase-type-3 Eha complex membrane subunit A n=1 Tax=Methanobrevibacter thaueri TaxID=190975 RepID=A0A8T3VC35_9EURY|nr:energy-converting hydrogenase A subunit A EhaA [Methanobrevibacter thaueri]MBE6501517.1 energy-converting hydrogenase A subunit A EhaA [Methanobrevibacter thaueri]